MTLTVVDNLIQTCVSNPGISFCRGLGNVIRALAPVAHRWDEWPNVPVVGLPAGKINWPDRALCVWAKNDPIVPDPYTFAADIGCSGTPFHMWFEQAAWSLRGVLVLPLDESSFEAIPLAQELLRQEWCLPDVQVSYRLTPDGWYWCMAPDGPGNAFLHRVLMNDMSEAEREDVLEAVDLLGNHMAYFLGTYLAWLGHGGGTWHIHPAKLPKVKMRNGRVRKVYKPGTVGYKQYKQKAEAANGERTDEAVGPAGDDAQQR